jgi:hypothetical protein
MTLILLLVHQLPQKESSYGIETKIASYEVFNGGVPSLDVAIMTHIFSYIKATSTDSNHVGGGLRNWRISLMTRIIWSPIIFGRILFEGAEAESWWDLEPHNFLPDSF